MSKYQLVIFDFDGTIADTSAGILNSIKYTQSKMLLSPISLEDMKKFIGPPNHESYSKYFGLTDDKLTRAVTLHKEYAIKLGYKELKFYNGITELFNQIHEKKSKIAVATLKAHQTAIKIFEEFKLSNQIDIIKGLNVEAPQTKAQLLQECLFETNTAHSDAVLIGDSSYDALGAKQADIDFIGVTYGFGFKTIDEVNQYPNVGIACDVGELYNLL